MFGIALVLTASPVAAQCPYGGYDRYVFFRERPVGIPEGLLLVKVDPAGVDRTGRVKILEPDDGLRGLSTIRVEAGQLAECGGWGALDQPVYMVGVLERKGAGEVYFKALVMRRRMAVPGRGADLEPYIVDPAYLPAAQWDRAPK
jgi:hypothetical protein